jgi:Flp pilus assembly protein TadD
LILYLTLSFPSLAAQQPIKTLQPAESATSTLDAALAEADALLRRGHPSQAETLLREYLANHPDSADAHFLLGAALFRQIQKGATIATRGSAKNFNEPKAKASLAEFTEGAKYRPPSAADLKIVALDYVLLGDYRDADKWLTKMLQWAPNDSEGWYYLGRTKYNENRFEEAVRAFQQTLTLDPANVKAEDNLGLAYAGLGRVNDAVSAYHTAIAWQKDAPLKNSGPFIDLASLLLDLNRSQEAIPFLHQAVEISPHDSKPHELMGKAYARLDQFPQAQAELENALVLAPENQNLPCMLGPVYRKRGLIEKAKAELDRCAALNAMHSSPEAARHD